MNLQFLNNDRFFSQKWLYSYMEVFLKNFALFWQKAPDSLTLDAGDRSFDTILNVRYCPFTAHASSTRWLFLSILPWKDIFWWSILFAFFRIQKTENAFSNPWRGMMTCREHWYCWPFVADSSLSCFMFMCVHVLVCQWYRLFSLSFWCLLKDQYHEWFCVV